MKYTLSLIILSVCWVHSFEDWYFNAIGLQKENFKIQKEHTITIAIVDDGVDIHHPLLKKYIWQNPKEVKDNFEDDDKNGYEDDVSGWNVSDNNPVVVPPKDRLDKYSHGTFIASVIVNLLEKALGKEAHQYVKLIPIKAISDKAEKPYLKDGFKGVEYATLMGADIIVCSWNVQTEASDEAYIIKRAIGKGAMVIASAGNFETGKLSYPAAYSGVIGVAGLGKDGLKTKNSDYGHFISIAAPSDSIKGIDVANNGRMITLSGTSHATSQVAAAVALLELKFPRKKQAEVKECLYSAANPHPKYPKRIEGQMGYGTLNIHNALQCDYKLAGSEKIQNNTHGYIHFSQKGKKVQSLTVENGTPVIAYYLENLTPKAKGEVKVYVKHKDQYFLFSKLKEDAFQQPVQIPAASFKLEYTIKGSSDWKLRYTPLVENLSLKYCRGLVNVTAPQVLTDGSGSSNYSNGLSCKWQVSAPPGKIAEFKFNKLDTEPNTDKIYLFNGMATNEKIIAVLSGQKLPPTVQSWTNETLMWFVTNDNITGQGWEVDIRFVDAPKPEK